MAGNLEEEEYDYCFKILLVGESGVGKSNILSRFTKNEFKLECDTTMGLDYGTKCIQHVGKVIKTQIWDTTGQEHLRGVVSSMYRNAMGVLLVYDISWHLTFENLDRWVNEVRSKAHPDLAIILVGNKSDMAYDREVAQDEAIRYAERLKIPFFETSALDCTNVELVFRELFNTILRRIYASFDTKLPDKVYISKINTIKLRTLKKMKKRCYKG